MDGTEEVRRMERDEEEEGSFSVRDLLVWSSEDVRKGKSAEERLAFRFFKFNSIALFYTASVFALLAAAEGTLKPHLEATGVPIILEFQKLGASFVPFFDLIGFPPAVWGFAPGIILSAAPNSWRGVAVRMTFLQGIGKLFKWIQNVLFRQGRPFWVSKKVEMWHCPTSYGFPSGHAMLLLLCIAPVIEHLWDNPRRIRIFRRRMSEEDGRESGMDKHDRFWALVVSTTLLSLFAANMIGRMFLGTHFLHSLLMGIVNAVLLLQVFTTENVAIIADRVLLSTDAKMHGPKFRRVVGAVLRCVGIALFLLTIVQIVYLFSLKVLEEDPHVWTERALKGCGVAPDTRDGSRNTAYEGIAILVGWILSLSVLAIYHTTPRLRTRSVPGGARNKIPSVPSYGTIVEKRTPRHEGSLPQSGGAKGARRFHWGLDKCLLMFSFLAQGTLSLSLAFLLPPSPLGHALSVFSALFLFPCFFEPVLVASDSS